MADLASLIMQQAYNQPNLVQQFQQGRQQSMANQLGGLQLQQAQQKAAQQNKLSQLMQTGTPEQIVRGGGTQQGLALAELQKTPEVDDNTKEWLKEERGAARSTVKNIDDRAAEIRSSYGKLEQLGSLAKNAPVGSVARRSAINSMIANIVRLNSPGIVSETELKTYTGGQGTTAAMLDFLSGKGVNVEALKTQIDPSGGNPDNLLGLGKSLILGQAQPIFDQYADAEARAVRSGMSDKAISTMFGENKNFNALRSLAESSGLKQQMGVNEPQVKPATTTKATKAPDAALQYLQANNTPEVKKQFMDKFGYLPEGF